MSRNGGGVGGADPLFFPHPPLISPRIFSANPFLNSFFSGGEMRGYAESGRKEGRKGKGIASPRPLSRTRLSPQPDEPQTLKFPARTFSALAG